MFGSRAMVVFGSLLLGSGGFCWTAAGETIDPPLAARELPLEILNECAIAFCADDVQYRSRWVGRTAQGSLFVVNRSGCASSPCSFWLVQKDATAVRTLLELNGAFTMRRGRDPYPAVELRTRTDADGSTTLRYEWNGEQYLRAAARYVYEVDGRDCGTRDECRGHAERALKAQQPDRAQRIWQRVYGISWI